MKKRPTVIFLLKVVLGVAFINNLPFPDACAQTTVTFSRPGNSMEYQHDGSNWVHVANTAYTYNADGNSTFELSLVPVTNQNLSKNESTYDLRGNRTRYNAYRWLNNAWSLRVGTKDSLVYNAQNKVILKVSNWLQNGIWEGEKHDYTYDANGHLAEEVRWYFNNGSWMLSEKKTFTISNGLITEELHEVRNGTTWRNYKKMIYAAWHVPNVQPASYTMQSYLAGSNQWTSPTRYTTTLTANGGNVILEEKFQNNAWVNFSRNTVINDVHGNMTRNQYENYTNGAWVMAIDNQTTYTYNSNSDMVERIYRHANTPGGPVVDQWKSVFSNFQYFTRISGTSESRIANLEITVYPNPATDLIRIQVAGQKPQVLKATVSDITGKIWKVQTFKATETSQLNLRALPKGIYLLHLQTESGSTVKRIVKQ